MFSSTHSKKKGSTRLIHCVSSAALNSSGGPSSMGGGRQQDTFVGWVDSMWAML